MVLRRRNCLLVFFATSTALFCLLNIYKSGILEVHVGSMAPHTITHLRPDLRAVLGANTVLLPAGKDPLAVNHSSVADTGAKEPPAKPALQPPQDPGGEGSPGGNSSSSSSSSQVRRPGVAGNPGDPLKTTPPDQYYVPLWQQRLKERLSLGPLQDNGTYFLAELLQVRVYEDDKAKWTIRELKQWMHYMFLAGVQHIYLCDHYKYEAERLDVPLKRYIDAGLVTYFPWSAVRHPMTAQLRCYQKMIDEYKHKHTWQIAVDMDEYPFSPVDTREDFLVRYLQNTTASFPNPMALTEISMNNYLMLGQGDRTKDLVIDRINRMTPKPANVLVKPIYKPHRVRANLHHNILQGGRSMVAKDGELRMLHYWGARTQDWGPDTPKTISITTPMEQMRLAWASQVRNSLLAFGETDAFSSTTGP